MSTLLNAGTLPGIDTIPVPEYDRDLVTPGIAHFGVGNFHRAHQAVYLDRYFRETNDLSWGIVGIGVSDGEAAQAKARRFADQDCLYTLTEYNPAGVSSSRVLGSLIGYLHAPAQPDSVLDLLSSPALRIVTLTITEGGYFTDKVTGEFDPALPGVAAEFATETPSTVFGFLVRALQRRRQTGTDPFTIVSCDNLPHNGSVAKAAVVGFAQQFDSDLAAWISERVAFPNSMVDRVVPYVSDEKRAELNHLTGVEDALAVTGESYLQWVVEDNFSAGRPDLDAVGVQFVDDVSGYETAKLRLLNAPHVLLSYPALLAGYRVVHEAMADPALRALLSTFMEVDVIPILSDVPKDLDLYEYGQVILERFGNPAIGDQLLRIATDGASKIPAFHTPTARRLVQKQHDTVRELLLLACYRRYLSGVDDRGIDFEVTEPTLAPRDRETLTQADVTKTLGIAAFQPLGLAEAPGAAELIAEIDGVLSHDGVIAAIERYGLRKTSSAAATDATNDITH